MKCELLSQSQIRLSYIPERNLPGMIPLVEVETGSETLPVWYHHLHSFCRISYLYAASLQPTIPKPYCLSGT